MSKSSRWARPGRSIANCRYSGHPWTLYKSMKTRQFFNIFTPWASLAGSGSPREHQGAYLELILLFQVLPGAHFEHLGYDFQAQGASGSSFSSSRSFPELISKPLRN